MSRETRKSDHNTKRRHATPGIRLKGLMSGHLCYPLRTVCSFDCLQKGCKIFEQRREKLLMPAFDLCVSVMLAFLKKALKANVLLTDPPHIMKSNGRFSALVAKISDLSFACESVGSRYSANWDSIMVNFPTLRGRGHLLTPTNNISPKPTGSWEIISFFWISLEISSFQSLKWQSHFIVLIDLLFWGEVFLYNFGRMSLRIKQQPFFWF